MNHRRYRVYNPMGWEWDDTLMLYPDGQFSACFSAQTGAHFDVSDGLVIAQCTGLRDRNGTLVYEGDIVEFKTHDGVGVVEYKPPCFMAGRYSLQGYDFEVIGNKFENAGLLEGVAIAK